MKKICFIILHYNYFKGTCECLDSILSMDNQELIEIVVIDNASQDDSYIKLKEKYHDKNINFLHNEKNLGFSEANNIAYEFARDNFDLKYVIFTNNDICFIQKDFIERIESAHKKSSFSVLGPDIYNPNIKQHQSPLSFSLTRKKTEVLKTIILNKIALLFYPIYYRMFIWNKEQKQTIVEKEKIKYYENVLPSGACLIFDNEFLKQKKIPFWPKTFFYYEEYILALWCIKNGKKIVFDPNLKVLHYHGMATNTLGDKKRSMKFQITNIINSAKVYFKVLKKM